jgi:hypothetical protein
MNPSTTTRPAASAAATQRAASVRLVANGFSHSTCLPASRARRGPGGMHGHRQGHIDGVDQVGGQQRLVAAEVGLQAQLGREPLARAASQLATTTNRVTLEPRLAWITS